MPPRPGWYDGYWKNLDEDVARKIRTTCPRCGSADTQYIKQFKTWRCGRCEHIFVIKGLGGKPPWWQRFFRR